MEPKTVGMMGLRGVEGLNVVRKESSVTVSGRAGGGGDGGVQRGMKNVRGGGGSGSVRMNVNGPGRDTV